MSNQSLRAALEKVAREAGDAEHGTESGHGSEFEPECARCWAEEIRGVLAAHPAEPAPVVTDEAVDALAHVLFDREWVPGDWRWEQYPEPNRWQEVARRGLEAAAPLLGPRPLLHQGDVFAALDEVYTNGAMGGEWSSLGADAVMELARPMPTREALIEEFLRAFQAGGLWDGLEPEAYKVRWRTKWATEFADRVLALLNGAES